MHKGDFHPFSVKDAEDLEKLYVTSPQETKAKELLQDHKVAVICGVAGAGKTCLATILCLQLHRSKFEVQLFRSAEKAQSWVDDQVGGWCCVPQRG